MSRGILPDVVAVRDDEGPARSEDRDERLLVQSLALRNVHLDQTTVFTSIDLYGSSSEFASASQEIDNWKSSIWSSPGL